MDRLALFKESLPSLISGLAITLKITLFSLIIAIILGLIFGLMNISKKKSIKSIAVVYIDLIRGTPLLVQAFFIYFGLPMVSGVRIDPMVAGVVALSLNAGAYMAEIFRGGIQGVDNGQMEAARSLGLSYSTAMVKVVIPQAIRKMIPAIINQFIISLKDTSILSVIGIRELTQSGQIIIARTYQAFDLWLMVGVMYLVVITLLSILSKNLERSLSYDQSKRTAKAFWKLKSA
ncbi:polar amino acid transport system substrate-binding protein [Clostridium cavendishii DSM 21758]|uniref:Polar amino acid transport system substrate-binding protein n=1 Tax=Clostridium cavendishii DSM 21758 TaxID=1121302 RepID=A0A1M6D9K5_9CLOT|nr:amino acid ABC transporter permease [Clostridium cavendishii]SHI69820.1 polar amino acid transport system substrate-binding protein [Clostridium cavendishii DSM 21758]